MSASTDINGPDHVPSPFQGAINFRDLGGHLTRGGRRVARGRIFRSDALWDMTDTDLEHLGTLGVRTICDLRAEHERLRWPNRLPPGTPPRLVPLGFTPTGTQQTWDAINRREINSAQVVAYMQAHYRALAQDHVAHYAEMFATLLEPDALPLLFHCASGKDRTGYAAALILLALEVPRATILRDYVISDRNRRTLAHLFGPDVEPEAYEAVATADARYLQAAFDAIDAGWGGEDRYLREAMGVDASDRARLRDLLLDPI